MVLCLLLLIWCFCGFFGSSFCGCAEPSSAPDGLTVEMARSIQTMTYHQCRLPAPLPTMSSSPLLGDGELPAALLGDIKTEPPEELLAEPVDLSVHKTKVPPVPQIPLSCFRTGAPPVSPAPLGSASSAIPAVLSPGSILASSQGSGGQQILHVIHTIPSFQLPGKMGKLQTIPLVVQSLPVVYAAVPADGVAAAAVTVPLIGGDGKDAGSVKVDPGSICPIGIGSESDDSASESRPASFPELQREREAI
ncbi:Krueppel-like factor 8 isoform X3 [Podarcis muralis]